MIFAKEKQEQRLKWAFENCKNGVWGVEPDGEDDVICIRAADFDGQSGRLNDGERTLRAVDTETFDKVALRPGDLVMEKSGGGEKQLVGRTVLFDDARPSVCSNFLARCRPAEGINPAYLNYLMLAIYSARGTYPHIKQSTGIQNLDLSSYLDTRVSIPERHVQQRIANFLDEKTEQIDALIEKKRALLEKLAEQRQALITRAVTKGLKPHVPMQSSGIDWLGDIPSHWKLKRLRFAASSLNSMRVPVAAELRKGLERTYPYYGASGIIDYVDEYIFDFDAVLVAEDGANLLSRATPIAFIATGKYWVNNHAHILLPSTLTTWFCASILETYALDPHISGSAQPKLTKENLGSLLIWEPPLDEQHQIELATLEAISQMDPSVVKIQDSISTLADYRGALIISAITGQIPELNG